MGAWWLGYLIAGVISVLAGIPFWFLPKHLPKPESRKDSSTSSEQSKFITQDNKEQQKSYQPQMKFAEMAKGKSSELLSSLLSLSTLAFKLFNNLRIIFFPSDVSFHIICMHKKGLLIVL